ncbi:hypothetical protein ACFY00_36730 [Kitasatospora sp. NPDC001540]|uniref:hypothetical protein n=1 Tax=Kitasatospora sp. NPDC001540 TaxID=3364014 RepID=UPI0036A17894
MTNQTPGDAGDGPALRRILAGPGGPELLRLLAGELSGTDLTTLLLEATRRRAERTTPAEVMRRYRTDRFVTPADVDLRRLRRAEDALIDALPPDFRTLVPAPLVPLAAHTAVGPVDARKVVATVRGTEVAADPTNTLALEAARRRALLLAADPRSATPVRLATTQRVVRAQQFAAPGASAHFQLFGLVTAGRDTGGLAFERQHLVEHLRFAARALARTGAGGAGAGRAGAGRVEIRLTGLDPSAAPLIARVREALADTPGPGVGLDLVEDPGRASGRGYYTRLCYKVFVAPAAGAEPVEVADGGFVDWTQRLIGNRKERLLIGGYGVERLIV